MATFAPAAHPPILCEHNHGVINESNGEAIEQVCGGESFETDDGLPTFEDCLVTNTGGGTSTVRTDLICILLHPNIRMFKNIVRSSALLWMIKFNNV